MLRVVLFSAIWAFSQGHNPMSRPECYLVQKSQVLAGRNFDKPNAIPVSFRNVIGSMRAGGELIEGQTSEAGAYD